jgi:Domain of unknown function (DUF4145)
VLGAAAGQAHLCLSAGSPIGATLVARAVVEAIAKRYEITTGDLKSKIDALYAAGHITEQMRDTATELRFAGNAAPHGDVIAEYPAHEDAAKIVGLMDSMLRYVYQEPAGWRR